MNKLFFALCVLGFSSSVAFADSAPLLNCSFRESMSVSFGFSSVYTFKGNIKDAGSNTAHFYELDGAAQVSIDDTASTNFPGKHIATSTAQINNHPWGQKVMLDITSADTTGAAAFRILVFPGISNTPNPFFQAYKIDTLTGNGLSGSCFSVDSRLQE